MFETIEARKSTSMAVATLAATALCAGFVMVLLFTGSLVA